MIWWKDGVNRGLEQKAMYDGRILNSLVGWKVERGGWLEI